MRDPGTVGWVPGPTRRELTAGFWVPIWVVSFSGQRITPQRMSVAFSPGRDVCCCSEGLSNHEPRLILHGIQHLKGVGLGLQDSKRKKKKKEKRREKKRRRRKEEEKKKKRKGWTLEIRSSLAPFQAQHDSIVRRIPGMVTIPYDYYLLLEVGI